MVTAEILLDARIAALRVGQFKGLYDEVPDDPALHQAMRDFLRDLRTGAHPLNRQQLRAYRQWADQHILRIRSRGRCRSRTRARLFRSTSHCCRAARPPISISGATQTGLSDGLRAALRLLTRHDLKAA